MNSSVVLNMKCSAVVLVSIMFLGWVVRRVRATIVGIQQEHLDPPLASASRSQGRNVGFGSQTVLESKALLQQCLPCGRKGYVACYGAKTYHDMENDTSRSVPTPGHGVDVYVLQLEQGKYYVGATSNWEQRQAEHFSGNGSTWTKRYKPIAVVEVQKRVDPLFEDLKVKEYMFKYGMNHVRGGSYSKVELEDAQVRSLQKEHRNASGRCFECGSSDHVASACPQIRKKNDTFMRKEQPSLSTQRRTSFVQQKCTRCGREGHVAAACYAKTRSDGKPLSLLHQPPNSYGRSSDMGPLFHPMRASRPAFGSVSAAASNTKKRSPLPCLRCGREGHEADSCYAKATVDGAYIISSGMMDNNRKSLQRNHPFESYDPFATSRARHKRVQRDDDESTPVSRELVCFRCGHGSHLANQCYATRHVNGSWLGPR